MRAVVCRWFDDQCRVHGGTTGKVEDMESRDGEEWPSGEHEEDHSLFPPIWTVLKFGKDPCGVCHTGAERNASVFVCLCWVHKNAMQSNAPYFSLSFLHVRNMYYKKNDIQTV